MDEKEYKSPEEWHRERREEHEQQTMRPGSVMRTIFGIIMIIVYVGMGIALLCNAFNWQADWAWTRYIVGVMLVIYGIWRAYRQIKGIDSSV